MKKFIAVCALFSLLLACKNNSTSSETSQPVVEKSVVSDSATIAETIHGFYKFYSKFENDTTQYNFIDDSGKYLKLDQAKLKNYLGKFFQSGFVSEEFVINEQTFYSKVEKLWQNEEKGDVPSGMDADRMYCAQDGEYDEFTTAPVNVTVTGDRATAKMMFKPDSGNGESRNYELRKENGKWLITKVECDMGIN